MAPVTRKSTEARPGWAAPLQIARPHRRQPSDAQQSRGAMDRSRAIFATGAIQGFGKCLGLFWLTL